MRAAETRAVATLQRLGPKIASQWLDLANWNDLGLANQTCAPQADGGAYRLVCSYAFWSALQVRTIRPRRSQAVRISLEASHYAGRQSWSPALDVSADEGRMGMASTESRRKGSKSMAGKQPSLIACILRALTPRQYNAWDAMPSSLLAIFLGLNGALYYLCRQFFVMADPDIQAILTALNRSGFWHMPAATAAALAVVAVGLIVIAALGAYSGIMTAVIIRIFTDRIGGRPTPPRTGQRGSL